MFQKIDALLYASFLHELSVRPVHDAIDTISRNYYSAIAMVACLLNYYYHKILVSSFSEINEQS